MIYSKKIMYRWNKFYRRLDKNNLRNIIIVKDGDLFSISVIELEVSHRTVKGLEFIHYLQKLGLIEK
jgi:hypothetical protein